MVKDIMTANEAVTPNEKEIRILKEHFPACFSSDGSFDIERFKEYLSDKVAVKNEGYELRFLGICPVIGVIRHNYRDRA